MTTIHTGDCSTGCDECMRRCAPNHERCIGTVAQRAEGDALYYAQPLIVTPRFYDKYYRPGANMVRGHYS